MYEASLNPDEGEPSTGREDWEVDHIHNVKREDALFIVTREGAVFKSLQFIDPKVHAKKTLLDWKAASRAKDPSFLPARPCLDIAYVDSHQRLYANVINTVDELDDMEKFVGMRVNATTGESFGAIDRRAANEHFNGGYMSVVFGSMFGGTIRRYSLQYTATFGVFLKQEHTMSVSNDHGDGNKLNDCAANLFAETKQMQASNRSNVDFYEAVIQDGLTKHDISCWGLAELSVLIDKCTPYKSGTDALNAKLHRLLETKRRVQFT